MFKKILKFGNSLDRNSWIKSQIKCCFHYYPLNAWMSNLPDSLTTLPMNWIAIPGSHDSFTYSITSCSQVAPDAEDIIKNFTRLFGGLAKRVIARWAKTQDLDPHGQLNAGIRYFDIRTAINKFDNSEIYSCHSLFAGQIKKDLLSIRKFLDSYEREVVLLDLKNFYEFTKHDHYKLANILETIFSYKLAPYSEIIPSLNDMWKSNHQVIVFYHCDNIHKPFLWPGYMIPSPWPQTDNLGKMLHFLSDNYKEGHFQDYFYINQGVLTPTPAAYLIHMMESLKSIMAKKATPAFGKWLEDKEIGKGKINCSIVDFADSFDYVPSVLRLNFNHVNVSVAYLNISSLINFNQYLIKIFSKITISREEKP